VPLIGAGQPFGVLALQSYTERVRYSSEDLELMTFVAQHVASAIERQASPPPCARARRASAP